MNLNEQIRYYRMSLNLSQTVLASGICSVSYLSKIENGLTKPSDEIYKLLLYRLGLNIPDQKENFKEDIQSLLKFILQKDSKNAEKLFNELYKSSKEQVQFKIISIIYTLIIKDNKINEELIKGELEDLTNIKDNLSMTNQFYFLLASGLYFYYKGMNNDSYGHLKSAEKILNNMTPDPLIKGYFYYLLGLVTNRAWKNLTSLEYSRIALKIFEEICEFGRLAECRILSGIINLRIENWEEATKQFTLAEKIALAVNNGSLLGKIYHNLGYLESRKGNLSAALDLYIKSLRYKQEDVELNVLPTLHNLIELHIKLDQSKEALKLINEGFQIMKKNAYDRDYALLFTNFKNILNFGIHHENTAYYIQETILPYYEMKYDILRLNEFYPILGAFYENSKKYKHATHYYNLTIDTYKKLTHTEEYY